MASTEDPQDRPPQPAQAEPSVGDPDSGGRRQWQQQQHRAKPQLRTAVPEELAARKPATAERPQIDLAGSGNLLSNLFHLWVLPLVRNGRTGTVLLEELKLGSKEGAKLNGSTIEDFWQQEMQFPERPSIQRATIAAYGPKYLRLGLYKLLSIGFTYLAAVYFLKRLLESLESLPAPPRGVQSLKSCTYGHLMAIGLLGCTLLACLCTHQLIVGCTRIGIQVRAALMALIYRKTLRLNMSTNAPSAIVNLVSNDCNRIAEACLHFHDLWSAFVDCAIAMGMAMYILSPVAVVPAMFAVMLVVLPLQWVLARRSSWLSTAETRETTKRVHLMSEMLTAAKLVRFYCLEKVFAERIFTVRADEVSYLYRALAARSVKLAIVFSVPCVSMLVCLFMIKVLNLPEPSASQLFTVLCIFNCMRYPILTLPVAVKSSLGAVVCFKKLDDFLMQPEATQIDPAAKRIPPEFGENDPNLCIVLEKASFQYVGSDKPVLQNLSFRVRVGEIVAIVGDVGAGKSSLLTALMHQLPLTEGAMHVKGRVAYVPHDAWLLNATLRENVILASPPPFSHERYLAAIRAAGVEKDLNVLAYGDQTELGERGMNLSMGQRLRVSLARAAYDPAEVVLLDDPLNVMDPSVGNRIFNNCLRGFMKERAIVFITNQLHYLRHCDRIVVLKDGKLLQQGTYEELMANNFDLATLVGDNLELEGLHDMDELAGEIRRLETIPAPTPSLNPAGSTVSCGRLGADPKVVQGCSDDVQMVDLAATGIVRDHTLAADTSASTLAGVVEGEEAGTGKDGARPSENPAWTTFAALSPRKSRPKGSAANPLLGGHNSSEASLEDTSSLSSTVTNHVEPTVGHAALPHGVPNYHRINEKTLSRLNDATITALIERAQISVLSTGATTDALPQINREVNALANAVEQNQLTIHSIHAVRTDGLQATIHGQAPSISRMATRGSFRLEEEDAVPEEEDVLKGEGLWLRRRKRKSEGPRPWRIYAKAKYGWFPTIIGFIIFFCVHALRLASDFVLSMPFGGIPEAPRSMDYMTSAYAVIGGVLLLALALRAMLFAFVAIGKSIYFHDRMFAAILRARISFYELTPLGRILNAFARHLHVVDESLADAALQALHFLPIAVGASILSIILLPWAAIPASFLALATWLLVRYVRPAEEALKRLEATCKPPIFAHLSATIEGLNTVRTYGIENRFNAANLRRVDTAHKALFAFMMVKAWLALHLDILACLFAYSLSLLSLLFPLNVGVAGVVLTNGLQLIVFLRWSARVVGDARVAAKSVRELEWLGKPGTVPLEKLTADEHSGDGDSDAVVKQLPAGWPREGKIEYRGVVVRYRRYGVAVLKDLSFVIRSREKVGIVGLTGSGKSTLLLSLLRITEPDEGEILIDDLDVRQLALQDLRSRIAVIPQEPVLFDGTFRANLDPHESHTDAEIWQALKAVHLADKIRSMPLKLESDVENGKNCSLGQRQLLCIARAMLLKATILVVDDFASAIDVHTDLLIQDVIYKQFAQHTVLTIASRLNTIAARSDRIMVLHEGRVAEFAPPLDLLSNPKGLFRSLVEQSGDDALEKLRALAHAAEPSPGCDCSSEGGTTATATGVSSAAAQPMAGGAAGLVEPSASPSTANFSRRAGLPAGPVSPMPMSLLGMFIDPGEATPTAEAGRRPVSSDPDLHVAAAASNGISCDRAVDNPPVRSSHAENNG